MTTETIPRGIEERLPELLEHCDIVPVSQEQDEQEWLDARRLGIGGSDAGTILEVSPYSGPYELWMIKTSRIPDPDLSDSEAVYWGHRLEDIVRDEAARRLGVEIWKPDFMLRSKARPWQQVSLDGLFIDPDLDELAIYEGKTAGWHMDKHWGTDDIPEFYEAQVVHACAVTGRRRARMAVLIGGNQFKMRELDIDEEMIDLVNDAEEAFWTHHVLADVPPMVDATDACTDIVKAVPGIKRATRHLGKEARDVAFAYLDILDQARELDEQKKVLANWLRDALGRAEVGRHDGIVIATWTTGDPKIPWKAVAEDAAAKLEVPLDTLAAPHIPPTKPRTLRVPAALRKLKETLDA